MTRIDAPSELALCDLNSDGLLDIVALHAPPSSSSSASSSSRSPSWVETSLVWFEQVRGESGDLSFADPRALQGTLLPGRDQDEAEGVDDFTATSLVAADVVRAVLVIRTNSNSYFLQPFKQSFMHAHLTHIHHTIIFLPTQLTSPPPPPPSTGRRRRHRPGAGAPRAAGAALAGEHPRHRAALAAAHAPAHAQA